MKTAAAPENATPLRRKPSKETQYESIASFVGFFIFLLVLKTFFVPLFIIPTGSMAETLYGAHAIHTCPNCGCEYPLNWPPPGIEASGVIIAQCPNCRWREHDPRRLGPTRQPPPPTDQPLTQPLREIAGDRIMVHGWIFDPPFNALPGLGPQRWDVVVFKVPSDGQTNYIKRLIGLPGETIEIIDGDVYADGEILQKPDRVQRVLWMPFYRHDYRPRQPSRAADYHPRFAPVSGPEYWEGLDTRVLRVPSPPAERCELLFVSRPSGPPVPARITDLYAYNGVVKQAPYWRENVVSDTRLSAQVTVIGEEGYVELSISKYDDRFRARLYGDGQITLERTALDAPAAPGELWGQHQAAGGKPAGRLALYVVDHVVGVEWNDQRIIATSPAQYSPKLETVRHFARNPRTPELRIAVSGARAEFRHLRIDRDIHYASEDGLPSFSPHHLQLHGVMGHPLTLGPEEYFVCGDNSPSSLDSRFLFSQGELQLTRPLRARMQAGRYQPGTVAADQMIGRAFFVYWPGFLPLLPDALQRKAPGFPNILLDLGRARWIH